MKNLFRNDRLSKRWRRLGVSVLAVLLLGSSASLTRADSLTLAHAKLMQLSGAIAFPTGRFGNPDPSTNHAGNKAGFNGGFELGLMVGELLALGVSLDYARFNIDFGGDTTVAIYKVSSAHTTALFGQAWVRALFPGGYAHWRPYALLGLGVGRPKATIESPGHPSVARFEYTVNTSVGLTAGVGVLIPASKLLAIMIEPRYRVISTKGSGYEELRVYHDGSSETFLDDQNGNRLRQKSNTTWWELRVGLMLTVR
jgi:hypothetical protein